jgi:hypothetical protein
MSITQPIPCYHNLIALQDRAAALVDEVRDVATASILRQNSSAAAGLLSDVPIRVCVELVEVHRLAREAGFATADLTAQFDEEERLLFEMVIGLYDTVCHAALPAWLESAPRP